MGTSDWIPSTLGAVTTWTSGGTPKKSMPSYWDGNIPWISASSMKTTRLSTSEHKISEVGLENGSRLALKDSVLLLVRGSELHKRIPIGIATCPIAFNQDVKALRAKEGLLPVYLFYWLLSNENLLLSKVEYTGIGAGKLDIDVLKKLQLDLPPILEQRAIAYILGTLDDKIELNQCKNETLEAIARALFKSWFVDFDPVRSKMESRWRTGESLPYLPAHSSDLFPERLVDSELGKIPEGWEAGCFGDLVSRRKVRVGEREAIVLSAVASGELVRSDDHFTKRVYSKNISKYLAVEQWDIAYNPSRINIGSVGMLKEPILGAVSPVYVVARLKPAYRWFFELSLRSVHTKEWINTLASGSVRQSLTFDNFATIPCIIPPEQTVLTFDKQWTQLHNAICAHIGESETVAAMRDTLLPKLISGELRVKNLEKFLKEVDQ